MPVIDVIKADRGKLDSFLRKLTLTGRDRSIDCRYVNVLYSPCWIFAFGALFSFSNGRSKYTGYLGGVDELSLSPGTIKAMPATESIDAKDSNILADKLAESEAEAMAWEYSKKWIIRNNRILHKIPERTETHCIKVYKKLYLLEFCRSGQDKKFYKAMDSLTGDLEDIELT